MRRGFGASDRRPVSAHSSRHCCEEWKARVALPRGSTTSDHRPFSAQLPRNFRGEKSIRSASRQGPGATDRRPLSAHLQHNCYHETGLRSAMLQGCLASGTGFEEVYSAAHCRARQKRATTRHPLTHEGACSAQARQDLVGGSQISKTLLSQSTPILSACVDEAESRRVSQSKPNENMHNNTPKVVRSRRGVNGKESLPLCRPMVQAAWSASYTPKSPAFNPIASMKMEGWTRCRWLACGSGEDIDSLPTDAPEVVSTPSANIFIDEAESSLGCRIPKAGLFTTTSEPTRRPGSDAATHGALVESTSTSTLLQALGSGVALPDPMSSTAVSALEESSIALMTQEPSSTNPLIGETDSQEHFMVVFQPAYLGLQVDWETGVVSDVADWSQAKDAGVKVGMRLHKINGKNYTEELLRTCIVGDTPYSVTIAFEKNTGGFLEESSVEFANSESSEIIGVEKLFEKSPIVSGHDRNTKATTKSASREQKAAIRDAILSAKEVFEFKPLQYRVSRDNVPVRREPCLQAEELGWLDEGFFVFGFVAGGWLQLAGNLGSKAKGKPNIVLKPSDLEPHLEGYWIFIGNEPLGRRSMELHYGSASGHQRAVQAKRPAAAAEISFNVDDGLIEVSRTTAVVDRYGYHRFGHS